LAGYYLGGYKKFWPVPRVYTGSEKTGKENLWGSQLTQVHLKTMCGCVC